MDGREAMISTENLVLIITAAFMGTISRLLVLKVDYRQYPSYPNGFLIHIVIAFIASVLGGVFVPALMSSNWTAVTFLSLAIQQFREVRKSEKESLKDLEHTEFTPRGNAYIDGIAKTFESRNYFALLVSLCTGIAIRLCNSSVILLDVGVGIVVGTLVFLVLRRFSKGKKVGDIANIQVGHIEIKDYCLFVDGIFVSNLVATEHAQQMILEQGVAFTIEPKEAHFRVTLDNFGQRKAILFEATRTVGVKRYHYSRKDYKSGKTIFVLVPLIPDKNKLINAVKNTPLLESVRKNHELLDTNFIAEE